jgi:hypothetical protein
MFIFLSIRTSAVCIAFTALVLSAAAPALALSGPECLRQAYPEFWAPQVTAAPDQTLVSVTGQRFEFDEHKDQLPHAPLLNQADLKTQMAQPYAAGFPATPPLRNQDPGRMRAQPFFLALYGATPTEVQRHLVAVPWAPNGRSLAFTRLNGAAQALERVGRTLAQEAATAAYVRQPAGSFYWRRIAGAPRMSVHAFGAAVDFTLPHGLGRYWQWSGCTEEGACTYPAAVLKDPTLQRVVTVFEQEGFIWGGKWAHFDTVHFEYRPELVGPACWR